MSLRSSQSSCGTDAGSQSIPQTVTTASGGSGSTIAAKNAVAPHVPQPAGTAGVAKTRANVTAAVVATPTTATAMPAAAAAGGKKREFTGGSEDMGHVRLDTPRAVFSYLCLVCCWF